MRLVAHLTGHPLDVLNTNSAMDTTELLGGFEQVRLHFLQIKMDFFFFFLYSFLFSLISFSFLSYGCCCCCCYKSSAFILNLEGYKRGVRRKLDVETDKERNTGRDSYYVMKELNLFHALFTNWKKAFWMICFLLLVMLLMLLAPIDIYIALNLVYKHVGYLLGQLSKNGPSGRSDSL